MKRKADQVSESDDGKICIYIDEENADSILDYIESSKKYTTRFAFIKGIILGDLRNDCFKREIEGDIRDIWAMRFDLHGKNGRIYCKKVTYPGKIVYVMGEVHVSKKSESNGPKEIAVMKRVHSYEYDCK